MADVESNILEVEAEFKAFIDGFNFTLPGKDASLGKDIAVEAARGIQERTVADQESSSGGPLRSLDPKYKARKVRKHGVDKIGVLTGQMLSQESLLGKPTITAGEVTMAYGTGEKPTKFATSGTITGDEPTDKEKAEYFTDSGRPFYELDGAIGDKLTGVVAEALEDYTGGF